MLSWKHFSSFILSLFLSPPSPSAWLACCKDSSFLSKGPIDGVEFGGGWVVVLVCPAARGAAEQTTEGGRGEDGNGRYPCGPLAESTPSWTIKRGATEREASL